MAGALAVLLMGSATPSFVYASDEEGGDGSPSTSSEIPVEDWCLDEGYLAYLKENGIDVVNGDIVVDTAEKFLAVSEWYGDYLTSIGFDYSEFDGSINDYVYALNYPSISKELRKQLYKEKIIAGTIQKEGSLSYENEVLFRSYITKQISDSCVIILLSPVILNWRSRVCVRRNEIDIYTYSKCLGEGDETSCLSVLGKIANDLLEKNAYDVNISDGDGSAYYACQILSASLSMFLKNSGLPTTKSLFGAVTFSPFMDSCTAFIDNYISSYPTSSN